MIPHKNKTNVELLAEVVGNSKANTMPSTDDALDTAC